MLFLAAPGAHGELKIPELPKKKRKDVGELPPQAVPVTVEVAPGKTVQIPLQVYGWRGRHVRYLLRSGPKLGKLSEIKHGENAVGFIAYQHTAPLTAEDGSDLKDRFTYAAQDDNGTSAAAEVIIKIVETAPEFHGPERVTFGDVVVGSRVSRTITLSNRGGGVLEGEFTIDAPWTIEPAFYRLGRGEEAKFKVTFLPGAEQEFRGRLVLPDPRPGKAIILTAMSVEPFRVEPSELVLVGNKENFVRAGTFKLTNRTDKERTFQIKADSRLKLPAEVVIPAGETVPVVVRLGEDQLQGIKAAVEFHDGQTGQSARVIGAAAPARLHAVESVDFGRSETGRARELPLKVENRGGTKASVIASVNAPFRISPDRFDLDPGQSIDLTLTLSPAWAGAVSSRAKIQTAGSMIEVPLSAEVVSRRTPAAPPKTTASLPGPKAVETQIGGGVPPGGRAAVASGKSIPRVGKVEVLNLKGDSATLSWAPPGDPALDYRVEARSLSMGADGSFKVDWIPVPDLVINKTAEQVTTRLEGMPAGATLTLRVVTLLPDGSFAEPLSMVFLSLEPLTAFFTLQRTLLALFGGILAVALWLQSGRAILGWKFR